MMLYSVFGDYCEEGHRFYGSYASKEEALNAIKNDIEDDADNGFFVHCHKLGEVVDCCYADSERFYKE